MLLLSRAYYERRSLSSRWRSLSEMLFESGLDVLCGGEELKFGGDCGKTAAGESGKPGIMFDPGEDRFNHPSSFTVLLTP